MGGVDDPPNLVLDSSGLNRDVIIDVVGVDVGVGLGIRVMLMSVHGSDRLGKRALLSQVLPSVLRQVDDAQDAQLNCKQNVDGAQALAADEFVDVHADEDVDESQHHCSGAHQPVRGVPQRAGPSSTAAHSQSSPQPTSY